MEKKIKKSKGVSFIDRPIIEFMHCLYLFANYEEVIERYKDRGIKTDSAVEDIIVGIDDRLSNFIKNEIASLAELSITDCLMIAFVSDYGEINTMEDFLKVFEKVSVEKLFDYIGGLFLSSNLPNLNEGWQKVRHSMEGMQGYIMELGEIDPSLKDEIIDLYESAEETRMRIRYALMQFYDKGYKYYEEGILEKAKEAKRRYVKFFEESSEDFMEMVFGEKGEGDQENFADKEIKIYVSYMQQFGEMDLHDFNEEDSKRTKSIGCNNMEVHKRKSIVLEFDKFLKIIADPTRFKIITYVSQKNWYVQALAKELGLAPSTIHHHLETMRGLEIVDTSKEGNKVLYKLNTKITKLYIQLLSDKIIRE